MITAKAKRKSFWRRENDLKIQEEELEQAESEAKKSAIETESQELSAEDVQKMGKRREQAKNQIANLESLIEKKVSSVKDAEEDVSTI